MEAAPRGEGQARCRALEGKGLGPRVACWDVLFFVFFDAAAVGARLSSFTTWKKRELERRLGVDAALGQHVLEECVVAPCSIGCCCRFSSYVADVNFCAAY